MCLPGMGWVQPGGNLRGFPGVMAFEKPDVHRSTQLSEMEIYNLAETRRAIVETNGLKDWDYEILCDDILGEV